MLQESTKTLLMKIVQSLELPGDDGWDDQMESGKECLYEMHQMTHSSFQGYRVETASAKWPAHLPTSAKLKRALPHVKAMVRAIRSKDQATALISGKAALAEI
jgi:hypothetical protein